MHTQNMRELQLATACTTGMGAMYAQTPDGQWMVMSPDTDSALAPYVGKLVYPTPDDCPSTGRWTECTIAFCRAQVRMTVLVNHGPYPQALFVNGNQTETRFVFWLPSEQAGCF